MVLEISNVTKKYSGFIIKDLNLALNSGYVLGIVGPNGAGKSTIIKMIMNLIKKDEGQIKLFGLDNINNEYEIKDKIGFVYDENVYFESMTLIENAKTIAPFYKSWDWELFRKYITKFELEPNKKLSKFSKGTKMKFQIAMALSHNAKLLIMDEPTTGLDPVFRRNLIDILHSYMEIEGNSIIFSTHITSDLERLADYIAFIDNGELLLYESFDYINRNYKTVKISNKLEGRLDKSSFIGLEKKDFGITGVSVNSEHLNDMFGDQIIIEKASIEDISYFISKGVKFNEKNY